MITNPIRVALVEDVPELRRSLVEALSSAPDLCMVGVWGTAEAALEAAPVVAPAVLLMDIH